MLKFIGPINNQRLKILVVYALAQILNIYSVLVIAQHYQSEQYGIYVLVSSLAGIIITLSNGKYHNNIITSNNPLQKKQLVWLSLIITISVNLIFIVLLFLIPVVFTGYNYLSEYLYHIPLPFWIFGYSLFAGLNILNDAVLNDREQYLRMSFGRLVKAGFFLLAVSLFYNLAWKGLILSIFLCQLIQFIFNSSALYKFIHTYRPNIVAIKEAAKEFKASPKYNILLSLLISATDYILYSIIGLYWGKSFLGNFSLAEKIIKLPVALIGQPLSELFFKKNADYYNTSNTVELKNNCILYLRNGFLLLIVPMIIAYLFSKQIVAVILPTQWQTVGWMASILAPVMLFYFIIASWRSLSIILKIQRQHFWVELICFISLVLTIALSGLAHLTEYQIVTIKMITEISISILLISWFYNKVNTLRSENINKINT